MSRASRNLRSCTNQFRTTASAVACFAFLLASGCGKHQPEVVIYCSLDREFSEPILQAFEKETGVRVLAKYDVESTKTVGLVQQLLAEAKRPRCDVFWNNEILNTLRLRQAGLLAPYASPIGLEYPAEYRDKENRWFGFAARVRVLLVNTQKVDSQVTPTRFADLALPRWRGRVGIAKPLFGTTATQVACLFATMGPQKAKEFLLALKANEVQILSGNKQVAIQVGNGTLDMGLTDTDDSLEEIRARKPVKMVFLEDSPNGMGVLLIPNTLAVIADGPNSAAAKQLVEYVLSPKTERELALGPSGQIPLHPKTNAIAGTGLRPDAKKMAVDFERAVGVWDEAMTFIREEFLK